MRLSRLACTLLALAPYVSAQGSVWVVDQANGPGTDFTTIGDAVSSATSGDAIVVRSGNYFETLALVGGKSLTISADEGASVQVVDIFVYGVPEGSSVTIRGIDLEPLPMNAHALIQFSEGVIWLEDVEGLPGLGGDGIVVRNSSSVVLTRCRFTDAFTGLATAYVQDSRVVVFDSVLQAGSGSQYGMEVISSQVLVSGGRVQGQDGANAVPGNPCTPATAGQPAVRMFGLDPELTTLGATVQGGAGGEGVEGSCGDAPDGPPVLILDGIVTALDGPARSTEITSPRRVGETATVTFDGQPGDRVVLFLSAEPRMGTAATHYEGWSVVRPPLTRMLLGVVPPSGTLSFVSQVAPLDAGLEFVHLHAQGFALVPRSPATPGPMNERPAARIIAASPSTLLMLAPGL